MKRVLIAEESRDLRNLLLVMLPTLFRDWETVGAGTLPEAQQRYRNEVFALALIDVDFGGPGGAIPLLREWTGLMARCPVVVTTRAHSRIPEIWEFNPAEVLLKPWDVHEIRVRLARAIAPAASSRHGFATRVDGVAIRPEFCFAGVRITPNLECLFPDGHRERIGAKEYGILAAFAHAQQSLLPRETLLREVWGADANSQSNSVNVYVSRLRKLFAEHGGSFDDSVTTEAKIGWRLAGH